MSDNVEKRFETDIWMDQKHIKMSQLELLYIQQNSYIVHFIVITIH
jgi:hypothetical protein